MGRRKKNNQKRRQERIKAKIRRNKKKLKRLAKDKTAGQKLANLMQGRAGK